MVTDRADTRRRRLLFGLGVATVVLAAVMIMALSGAKKEQLPASIVGQWYSDEPRYQTCSVDISQEFLIIGGADGNTYVYEVKAIRSEAANNRAGRFYTLLCEDDEGMELEFRLYHEAETGRLSYKNQRQVIWLKSRR